jgi:hypothetical protein
VGLEGCCAGGCDGSCEDEGERGRTMLRGAKVAESTRRDSLLIRQSGKARSPDLIDFS